ncbi:MAG: hypothetical protein N2512_01975 [Armatimonadetes bacterium]|nr:hypothetical protein [Armatimonadota bacterium]
MLSGLCATGGERAVSRVFPHVNLVALTASCVGLVVLGGRIAQAQPGPVEIPLNHCRIHWSAQGGLSVTCDGMNFLQGYTGIIVAHPPDWSWSYTSWRPEEMSVRLEKRGGRHILTIECRDEKVPWRQVVTAGPGDRFTVAYTFTQKAWRDPMSSQVCLFQPATSWFVGARFKASGPGGETTGEIPLTFGGVSNPFVNATVAQFDSLFGRLTVRAERPITLYDYQHRQHLWLGRDEPMPINAQQTQSAEFVYEPLPLVVGGVQIANVRVTERAEGEEAVIAFELSRGEGGPETVTVRFLADAPGPASADERQVPLKRTPVPVRVAVPLPGPGQYKCRLELVAEGKTLYQSPPLSYTVPRFLSIAPALKPFMKGDSGALVVRVSSDAGEGLRVKIEGPAGVLAESAVRAGKRTDVPIPLDQLPLGMTELTATLSAGGKKLGTARCQLVLAERRENAVVVDNRSGTLIVRGLPFCAQSCYTDMAGMAEVVETEAPLGFNAVAPYLSTEPAERRGYRDQLRKFMDRCAEAGMFVHLDIRGASRPPHTEEKWQWLREEIEAFRDHPALLCYYLADEPELGWASPEDCAEAYRRIKELDPWHPVTMVFCQPAAAARYAQGMDIVMTDPYPIPNGPPTVVVDFCKRIRGDVADALPLWIVPQAFGGGEWWPREPSRQEERLMTYLALIHGARHVQYFIRRPPAVNPSCPDLWSECRRLMLELSQLTPALASAEEAPTVTCSAPQVHLAAFQERGAVTVLAANVTNRPLSVEFTLARRWTGEAKALFENRSVAVTQGKWTDMIDAFGTRVYLMQVELPPADLATLDPRNLIVNPSFEDTHNAGSPDGAYIGYGADKAASRYVDPRTAAHGRQSMRLHTPREGQGISVAPYPVVLTPGKRYKLSVWARGERDGMTFRLALDAVSGDAALHSLTTTWREYAVEFTASEKAGRVSPSLTLISPGSAWFDALQVVPLD